MSFDNKNNSVKKQNLSTLTATDADYNFEYLEKYFGTVDNVKKIIDECDHCGARMVFSHLPDYKSLLIQEIARCMDCGKKARRLIHILN